MIFLLWEVEWTVREEAPRQIKRKKDERSSVKEKDKLQLLSTFEAV